MLVGLFKKFRKKKNQQQTHIIANVLNIGGLVVDWWSKEATARKRATERKQSAHVFFAYYQTAQIIPKECDTVPSHYFKFLLVLN